MRRALVLALTAVGCVAACGGAHSSAPASSSTPPSSSTPAPSAGTPEQAAMQGLQQMLQQGGQGAKAVEFTALKDLLPQLAGWEKGEAGGEQSEMMGMSIARAETEYNKGDVNVKLVANRFIVHASGYDLPGMDPVKDVVTAVPAARLAALVK